MNSFIKRIFALFGTKKQQNEMSSIPPREEMIDFMYDKELGYGGGTVARVIYSGDKTKRFVIVKDNKGYFKYFYEEIHFCTDEEWGYSSIDENSYPATWEAVNVSNCASFFGTEEEAYRAVTSETAYKDFFL